MFRFGAALAIILSTTDSVNAFQNTRPQSLRTSATIENEFRRAVSSASTSPEVPSNDGLGDAVNSVTNAARDTIASAVSDEPDAFEAEIALKKRMVNERTKTFKVTLPLASSQTTTGSDSILSMGLTLCQISKGRSVGDSELNLDSLRMEDIVDDDVDSVAQDERRTIERMDRAQLARGVDRNFQGLVVASVVEGSAAWVAGVRPGDLVKGTSATLGDAMWPKSTLDGVRSAVSSRKAVAGSIQFEFQRAGKGVDNQFELSLSRPIGLELVETEDGYVEVTGFTENAPTLVQYAVKVGDRVLAVDSSLGDKMWPVSTVEGVISAVTSRLPGQQISLRFERPLSNIDNDDTEVVMSGLATKSVARSSSATSSLQSPVDQKELLSRCRDIIRRYMSEEQQQARAKFTGKYAVPALVADKVMEALGKAGAEVDSVTLSMIMKAYLSCQKPEAAIRAFEAVVGLNANGSSLPMRPFINEEGKKQIVANTAAINVYTVSSLLKAHAINGDLAAIKRVLAATEGSMTEVDGLESMRWPGHVTPDTRCYNIAISAAVKSSAEDGLDVAMGLFHGMGQPGQETSGTPSKDLGSYNTVLSALTNSAYYEKALDLFYEMKQAGLKPDKYSYTALIKAVISNGDIDELLYDMKEQGVRPDVVTYNSIIKSLCEDRKFVAAKKMVNQMEASGVAPDSMTYGLLMSGLLKAGNPGACVTLFESACADRRTVPLTENVYLYTTAITAAAALGDHERGFDLVSRMNGLGIKPNMKTLTALIGACLSSGKAPLAADIYRRLENPDKYAMEQGLRALCLAGFPSEAFAAVTKQVHGSRILSGKQMMSTYKTLIHSALKRNEYDLARQAVTDLMLKGSIPSKAIFQAVFDAMNLFPQQRRALVELPTVDEYAIEKFSFMLFVLDSVQDRNLPCEGCLYSAIVAYGARLGGLPRKIASLLQSARLATESTVESYENGDAIRQVVSKWEDVLLKYDDLKNEFRSPASLPSLTVRIAPKDVRKVLKAEENLSFAGKVGRSRRR